MRLTFQSFFISIFEGLQEEPRYKANQKSNSKGSTNPYVHLNEKVARQTDSENRFADVSNILGKVFQPGFVEDSHQLKAYHIEEGLSTFIVQTSNVGIGTSTPQAGFVVTNGNVGIGTWAPGAALDVVANTGVSFTPRIYNLSTGSSATTELVLGNNTSGSQGQLYVNSSNNGASSSGGANSLNLWNTGAYPIAFQTNSTNRMIIDGTGNVGIGTFAPQAEFHIYSTGNTNNNNATGIVAGNDTTNYFIELRQNGGSPYIDFTRTTPTSTDYDARLINTGASRLDFATASAGTMMTISGANVGIGSTAPGQLLDVFGNARLANSGNLTVSGLVSCAGIQTSAAGLMSCTSDARLKDIHGSFNEGLSAVSKINPQTYSWKKNTYLYDGGVRYSGFIAQDVEKALPEAVNTGPKGYKQVSTTPILAAAVNAIKELDKKVQALKVQNDSLAARNKEFEERLEALEKRR